MLAAITSEETLKQIFPEMTEKDMQYAQNLNVNFNAIDKTVTVTTVAVNVYGQPLYKYTVNTADLSIKDTETTNNVIENNQPEGEVAQYTPGVVEENNEPVSVAPVVVDNTVETITETLAPG